MRRGRLAGPLAVLLLAGCAQLPPEAGFPALQAEVAQRAGARPALAREQVEDARAGVRARLAAGMDAAAAVDIALTHSPRAQTLYETLEAERAAGEQAGLPDNPFLHLSRLKPRDGDPAKYDLSLTQNLVSLLTAPARARAAEARFAAARQRAVEEVLRLAGEARAGLLAAQAAVQIEEVYASAQAATGAGLELARRQRAAGNITERTLLMEQQLHQQMALLLAGARQESLAARERLNALLGLWGADTQWRLASERLPRLPAQELPLAELETKAIEASLALAAQRQTLDALAQQAGVDTSLPWLRGVELGYGWEREGRARERAHGPSIGLALPLFDSGGARAAEAEARLRAALAQTQAQASALRAQARLAAARLQAARGTVEHYLEGLLPLARRELELAQQDYNAMQADAAMLLAVKRRQLDTGRQFVEALRDYWQARAAVEALLAGVAPQDMGGGAAAGSGAAAAMPGGSGGGH
jgi:cobalt-zinc-cadmium efflux system outer membrane protein